MVGHINFNEKISSRSSVDTRLALIAYPYALSVINSRRHCHFDLLAAGCIACARTFGALLFDNFTRSAAVRTGLYILNSSEERTEKCRLPDPCRRTSGMFPERFPVSRLFRDNPHMDLSESDPVLFHIRTPLLSKVILMLFLILAPFIGPFPARPLLLLPSKQVTEYITEYVAEISSIKIKSAKSAGSSCSAFKCCVAELVITGGVFQNHSRRHTLLKLP